VLSTLYVPYRGPMAWIRFISLPLSYASVLLLDLDGFDEKFVCRYFNLMIMIYDVIKWRVLVPRVKCFI